MRFDRPFSVQVFTRGSCKEGYSLHHTRSVIHGSSISCFLTGHSTLRNTYLTQSSMRSRSRSRCLLPMSELIHPRNNIPPKQRIQMYYGYSFESYCTSERPPNREHYGRIPGWGGDVDTNVQWCCVAKTKLADTRIIIGGEVDCVRGKLHRIPEGFSS